MAITPGGGGVPGCCCRGLDNQSLRNKQTKKSGELLPSDSEALNTRSCVQRLKVVCDTVVRTLRKCIFDTDVDGDPRTCAIFIPAWGSN